MKAHSRISQEQQARFCEHLAGCASWYKHLSLLDGGRFFIFTDDDAGKNYPVHPPHLAKGNTKAVYQFAFGKLAFAWSEGNSNTFISNGELFAGCLLEAELQVRFPNHAQIQLFPYVSGEFIESIRFHAKAFETIRLEQITPEKPRKNRDLLIEIERLHLRETELWQTMSNREREEIISEIEPNEISSERDEYKRLEERIHEVLRTLREEEMKKIATAVAAACQKSEVLWAK